MVKLFLLFKNFNVVCIIQYFSFFDDERFYLLLWLSLLHQPADFKSMLANDINLHSNSFFR